MGDLLGNIDAVLQQPGSSQLFSEQIQFLVIHGTLKMGGDGSEKH